MVTHTGKLQPVLIWREKPVLLALLKQSENIGTDLISGFPYLLARDKLSIFL